MKLTPEIHGIPGFIYDKLASRADFFQFIDQARRYTTANGAGRSCVRFPEKFFSPPIPPADKLSGAKGWGRAAQELARANINGGREEIREIIEEVTRRREKKLEKN